MIDPRQFSISKFTNTINSGIVFDSFYFQYYLVFAIFKKQTRIFLVFSYRQTQVIHVHTCTCSTRQELTLFYVACRLPLFLLLSFFFHRLFLRPPPSTHVVHVAFSESLQIQHKIFFKELKWLKKDVCLMYNNLRTPMAVPGNSESI